MQIERLKNRLAMAAATLAVATAMNVKAGTSATPAAQPPEHFTGTVVSVHPQNHVLKVKSWFFFKKTFNLGSNCTFDLWKKSDATAADVRPGEKVEVTTKMIRACLSPAASVRN